MSARDRLVASTIALMQRRGVAAAGIADILEAGNVSRRTVYLQFPGGKPELVAEATRSAADWITGRLTRLGADANPLQSLADFVSGWKALLVDNDFEANCPIVAAAMARTVAPAAADIAATTFTEWTRILSDTFEGRGIPARRASSLATTVVAAVEGAVVLGVATRSVSPLDDVEYELAALLDHASKHPLEQGVRS